ncbi:DNA damage-binding protein 1a [Diplonema papillatum]|nr:DNA damage-binding protein 1a [Diplonema papillatum]
MSTFHFVSTIHKPTAARHCAVGRFTDENATNLIVAYGDRLVISTVTDEGLTPVYDENMWERVVMLRTFRPRKGKRGRECLLVLFSDEVCCVLEWDDATATLKVVSKVSLNDPSEVGYAASTEMRAAWDENAQVAVFQIFDGQLKAVNVDPDGTLSPPQTLRLEETRVIDIAFVDNDVFGTDASVTALAVLYPHAGMVNVKTYCLLSDAKMVDGSFAQKNLEPAATRVTAAPGGLLVLGSMLIAYLTPTTKRTLEVSDFSSTTETGGKPPRAGYAAGSSQARGGGALDSGAGGWRSVVDDPAEPTGFTAVCQVSAQHYLLGNASGKLYGLTVTPAKRGGQVTADLKLECLGHSPSPSCLAWTGVASLAYVGSDCGDCLLIQLLPEPNAQGGRFEVVESCDNLGSVVHFAVVPSPTGADQIVGCSGRGADGSLRIVRNGIGISRIAALPLPGVRGMWTLPLGDVAAEEVIILSFPTATKALVLSGDEVSETDVPGFSPDEPTLHAGTVFPKGESSGRAYYWLQVTPSGVRVASPESRAAVHCAAADDPSITAAAASGSRVLSARGKKLCLHELTREGGAADGVALALRGERTLEHEVSCLSLVGPAVLPAVDQLKRAAQAADSGMPIDPPTPDEAADDTAAKGYCVVGFWEANSVGVLSIPDLALVFVEPVGMALPRSVLIHSFSNKPHLLCGLGDGSLVMWELGTTAPPPNEPKGARDLCIVGETKKTLNLGTQPAYLTVIATATQERSQSQEVTQDAVFVCTDKPAVVFAHNKRLQVSPLCVKSATAICPFNASALGAARNHLALISEDQLIIGSMDRVQKLQVTTIPLGRGPVCVSPLAKPEGHCVVVADGTPTANGAVQLMSEDTGEVLCTFALDHEEVGFSVTPVTFTGDPAEYVAVGTAYIVEEEEEPKTGRILLLSVTTLAAAASAKPQQQQQYGLTLVVEKEVQGAVFQLRPFQGKLVVSVNAMLHLFRWQDAGHTKELSLECSQNCHCLVSTVCVFNAYVVACDEHYSVTMFLYNAEESSFEEVGHDPMLRGVVAAYASPGLILVADGNTNLLTLWHEENKVDSRSLAMTSGFHLGYDVTYFEKGCLTNPAPYSAESQPETAVAYAEEATPIVIDVANGLLFGTVEGSIGAVIPLTAPQYEFLDIVQKAAATEVRAAYGYDCMRYRRYRPLQERAANYSMDSRNFVDGSLIEAIINMTPDKQQRVLGAVLEEMKTKAEALPVPPPTMTLGAFIDKLDTLMRSH